jgi:hypothetical protein
MPLRKKHVRRSLLALLLVGVLLPVAIVAALAWRIHSGAAGRALEADLAARLRCEAAVEGFRPASPDRAHIAAVDLVWTAGRDGRLRVRLDDVTAETNEFGVYVRAARGRVEASGPHAPAALQAVSHRLADVPDAPRLMAIVVDALDVDADLGPAVVRTRAKVLGLGGDGRRFTLSFYDPEALRQAPDPARLALEADGMPPPAVMLRLAAAGAGVFDGLRVDLKALPLGVLHAAVKGLPGKDAAAVRGTLDLAVRWGWADGDAAPATAIDAAAHGVAIEDWTAALPGGPVRATGEVTYRYGVSEGGRPEVVLGLRTDFGEIPAASLRRVAEVPAGLAMTGLPLPETVVFDALRLDVRATGGLARFEGPAAPPAGIPVLAFRVLGTDMPLVWADGRAFDAAAAWSALVGMLAPRADGPATP